MPYDCVPIRFSPLLHIDDKASNFLTFHIEYYMCLNASPEVNPFPMLIILYQQKQKSM